MDGKNETGETDDGSRSEVPGIPNRVSRIPNFLSRMSR